MITPFILHQPQSIEDACGLLTEHGDDAKLLAGGSELILLLKLGLVRPKHMIDIKRIPGLDEVHFDVDTRALRVGALVTHSALALSNAVKERFPLLVTMEQQVANVRVRNVGTVAGNLCFAEPHADPGTLLLAYGARIKARSSDNERTLEMADFFADYYETTLKRDEIVTEIEIPKLGENFTGAYLRFCPGERPLISVALLVGWSGVAAKDVRLVLGCVGPMPVRAVEVEQELTGRSRGELIADATEAGQRAALLCDPMEDIWGSKEYKRQIVKTLVARALYQTCEQTPQP
jgi:aerobic carbon-monoxide dehydrogenase medium subunit